MVHVAQPAKYVAQEYVSPPGVEILGRALTATLVNLRSEITLPIVAKHGFDNIDPEKWYPLQPVLDLVKEISQMPGGKEALIAVGVKGVEVLPFPPEVQTMEQAIRFYLSLSMQKFMFRNYPPYPSTPPEILGEDHYLVILNNALGIPLSYGYMWGLARRFGPKGYSVVIRPVPNPSPETTPGWAFDIEFVKK